MATLAAQPITMEQVKALIKKKDEMEEEIQSTMDWLQQPGRPGLKGGLVDKDGFPLNDVDLIVNTRQARSRLAALQTDHKAIMKEIEDAMIALHSQAKKEKETAASSVAEKPSKQDQHASSAQHVSDTRQPFARVDEIGDTRSPAAKCGLKVDDLILQFGSVTLQDAGTPAEALRAVGSVVRNSENQSVEVTVLRKGTGIQRLSLLPQRWEGNGLLGCLLKPVENPPPR